MTEIINDNIENVPKYEVEEQRPLGIYHAKQGVLLLNTALTVEKGSPSSHTKLWEEFTIKVISTLNQLDNIVWLIWGSKALQYVQYIDNSTHNTIISSHPSPFSVNRTMKIYPSFRNSRPFSKCNAILKAKSIAPIMW